MPNTMFKVWLQDAMKHRGLNASQLAKEVGVSYPTVGRWLTGANIASPRNCQRLAEYTGAPLSALLSLAGHTPATFNQAMELPEFREYMRRKYPATSPEFVDAIARAIDRR